MRIPRPTTSSAGSCTRALPTRSSLGQRLKFRGRAHSSSPALFLPPDSRHDTRSLRMLTQSPAWTALQQHQQEMRDVQMRALFAQDPQRFERFSLRLSDLLVDYSKHRITAETLRLLLALPRDRRVEEWRDRMFAGEKVHVTEKRAVLPIALRHRGNRAIPPDGKG